MPHQLILHLFNKALLYWKSNLSAFVIRWHDNSIATKVLDICLLLSQRLSSSHVCLFIDVFSYQGLPGKRGIVGLAGKKGVEVSQNTKGIRHPNLEIE